MKSTRTAPSVRTAALAAALLLCDAAGLRGAEPPQKDLPLPAHNPIDRLAALAQAGVPLFAIHGDRDTVVPLEVNSGELHKRYAALGGSMRLVVPPGQGHNMWTGFFQCEELVDFVIARVRGPAKPAGD